MQLLRIPVGIVFVLFEDDLGCLQVQRTTTAQGADHYRVHTVQRKLGVRLANSLVGLVAKASASRAADPGSIPACAMHLFSGSSHTSDLKIGNPGAALPGAWRCKVSAGTGRPGVSMLQLSEIESLICNFYLSVAAIV